MGGWFPRCTPPEAAPSAVLCPVDGGSFCVAGRVLCRVCPAKSGGAVPALCGRACALLPLCLADVLLRVGWIGKDVFTYVSDRRFSFTLRELRLANKSRCCSVERLNILAWSFAPFLKNAAWFCLCCFTL